jgi:hypothetical protein
LQKEPKLLEAFTVPQKGLTYDVDAEALKKAEILLAFPLSGLSARMRYLDDDLLFGFSGTRFAIRAAATVEKFAKLELAPVRGWGAATETKGAIALSPARSLRTFLPTSEGGTDKSDRLLEFTLGLVPEAPFVLWLAEHNLTLREVISPDILAELIRAPKKIWENFALEPGQKLQRGNLEAWRKRPDFLALRLENLESIDPAAVQTFLNIARSAFAQSKAAGMKVFAQDQFLSMLLRQPDELIDLIEMKQGVVKTVLTPIALSSAQHPLKLEFARMEALQWTEKGERFAAKNQEKEADGAWDNAAFRWGEAGSEKENPLAGQAVKERWQSVLKFFEPRQSRMTAAGLAIFYERQMRKAATARLQRIQMLERMGEQDKAQHTQARTQAEKLVGDLENVDSGEELANVRKKFKDEPPPPSRFEERKKDTLWALIPDLQPDAREQVETAMTDMGPGGSLYWLRYAAALRLERLKKAP